MELQGKVVVVTGGGSGIGAGLVRRFAQEGAAGIVVADLAGDKAAAVAAEVAGRVPTLTVALDVSRQAEVQALITRATQHFGRVDVLCSNAGILLDGGLEAPAGDWQRCWDVNLMAHVHGARAVLPQMVARGEGYLVHTASAAGLLAHPTSATYSVTKHAAVAFAEWVAMNYGDKGIRVSCLCPQGVRTDMLLSRCDDRQRLLLEGSVSTEQVADAVVKAMQAETFLVLPHPEVLDYVRGKAADEDRWLAGMRRLRTRFEAMARGGR